MVDILKKEAVDFGFVCNLTHAITREQFGKLSDVCLLDEVLKPPRASLGEQIAVLAGGKQQTYYNLDYLTEEELGRLADLLPATYVMPIFLQYLGFLKEEVRFYYSIYCIASDKNMLVSNFQRDSIFFSSLQPP